MNSQKIRINLDDEEFRDPELLQQILEHFGYCKFKRLEHYLKFARSEESSSKSITCYFDGTRAFIEDHVQGISGDLFDFLMQSQNLSFHQVVEVLKSFVSEEYKSKSHFKVRKDLVSSFFKPKRKRAQVELTPIDKSVLDQYEPIGNERFLKDHISLKTQRFFEIGYDPQQEIITIPIYNHTGDLIGVKARNNKDDCGTRKYLFPHRCKASYTLYGYFHNLEVLKKSDVVYVFEAEKSVMQAYDFGIRNCVALGCDNPSTAQVNLLLQLNPKAIVLMLDEGLPDKIVKKSLNAIQKHIGLRPISLYYWQPVKGTPEKCSPTDRGREVFEKILKYQLIEFGHHYYSL